MWGCGEMSGSMVQSQQTLNRSSCGEKNNKEIDSGRHPQACDQMKCVWGYLQENGSIFPLRVRQWAMGGRWSGPGPKTMCMS